MAEPCALELKSEDRCRVVMGIGLKAKKVFGQYAGDYIRVVDEEMLSKQQQQGQKQVSEALASLEPTSR
jgi:hypothetical protein